MYPGYEFLTRLFETGKAAFKATKAGESTADKAATVTRAMMRVAKQEAKELTEEFVQHIFDKGLDLGIDFSYNILVNLINVKAGEMLMAGASKFVFCVVISRQLRTH